MSLRDAVTMRVVRAFVYWGLVRHPYGRAHAKDRYTPLGGVDR